MASMIDSIMEQLGGNTLGSLAGQERLEARRPEALFNALDGHDGSAPSGMVRPSPTPASVAYSGCSTPTVTVSTSTM